MKKKSMLSKLKFQPIKETVNLIMNSKEKEFQKIWSSATFKEKIEFIVRVGRYCGKDVFEKLYSLMLKSKKTSEQRIMIDITRWILERSKFLSKINEFIIKGEEKTNGIV